MADISIWQFPLSLILSLTFLAGVFLLWRYLPDSRFRRVISGKAFCIILLAVIAAFVAVEGTWIIQLHHNPFFLAASILMMLTLGLTVLDCIKRRKSLSFLLCHSGMFLIVFGAFFGAPDIVDEQLSVGKDQYESVVPIPFNVRLDDFRVDYYEDGRSPKQYSSVLDIDGKRLVTSVNHPCRYGGYKIYQSGYDRYNGAYSVLKIVKNPWMPFVYIGMLLLAVGAFLKLRLDWNRKTLVIAIILAAALFTVISVARINFGTLMPALRSWWFVPHLVLYMLAYSSLALALVIGLLAASGTRRDLFRTLSFRLFDTASVLLLLGMLCGAVWAEVAWGDWWTWDAKECWAAVTWLITIIGTHLPDRLQRSNTIALVFILLSFVAMLVAWQGVEYFPASQISLHTY